MNTLYHSGFTPLFILKLIVGISSTLNSQLSTLNYQEDSEPQKEKDAMKDEGSKDTEALLNHADKLISLLLKLKENISEEVKAKLKDVVKEINKALK